MRAPTPFVFVPLLLLTALPAQRNRGERPEPKLQNFTVENATFASTSRQGRRRGSWS